MQVNVLNQMEEEEKGEERHFTHWMRLWSENLEKDLTSGSEEKAS